MIEKEEVFVASDIRWQRGGHIKVNDYPPKGWDDLTTEEQFDAIYKAIGQEVQIKSIQFKY